MHKLLMQAFPGWYKPNSVYALYPFTTVKGNSEILQKKGTANNFDFNKPSFVAPPIPITTWQGVVDVLHNQEQFKVPCTYPQTWTLRPNSFTGGRHTFEVTQHDYMLSGDSTANAQQRAFIKGCLYKPENGLAEVRQFYESITEKLIHQHSRKVAGSYQVDIVAE
jgi:hypothetical protein